MNGLWAKLVTENVCSVTEPVRVVPVGTPTALHDASEALETVTALEAPTVNRPGVDGANGLKYDNVFALMLWQSSVNGGVASRTTQVASCVPVIVLGGWNTTGVRDETQVSVV